jgi:quercetin dioxygenase-like cupin family protein
VRYTPAVPVRECGAGSFVLVPPETPHRYVGAGDEPVRVASVQPSGRVVRTNV